MTGRIQWYIICLHVPGSPGWGRGLLALLVGVPPELDDGALGGEDPPSLRRRHDVLTTVRNRLFRRYGHYLV